MTRPRTRGAILAQTEGAAPITEIASSSSALTVIVTVDAPPELLAEVETHARRGLTLFPTFAGFVAGALHRSRDGERLLSYTQWRTEVDYRACIEDDARWHRLLPSSARIAQLVERGEVVMDVRFYDVLAVAATS